MMRISEIFGPTIQGEGPYSGRAAMFVRTLGCNLDCRWCDTPYTWNFEGPTARRDVPVFDYAEQIQRHTVDSILTELAAGQPDGIPPALLVVTGGEPMIQEREVAELVDRWNRLGHGGVSQIETNGTRFPTEAIDALFVVSPKIQTGTTTKDPSGPWDRWVQSGTAVFKFVVSAFEDMNDIDEFVEREHIPRHLVWLMPEGQAEPALDDWFPYVAEAAIERGWNVSHRLHVLAWGTERGR